jgi:hypothetical protein
METLGVGMSKDEMDELYYLLILAKMKENAEKLADTSK